ncbi:MAG: DUF393 domain-containing protein [Phycisphaerales bacterium]|nr:DUF393 domain-containing protein [Phycisphaerales bacterium]
MAIAAPANPVLFYDGDCGLCAASVRWCLDRDRRGILRFAPLQGATYAGVQIPDKPMSLDTMVLLDADGLHTRSEAALRAMRYTGGLWASLATLGRLFPRFIRDRIYRSIAKRRIAWFGPADSCKLPTPVERDRFLP